MRVYLGSDHAGFELKNHLVDWLKNNGHEPVDCGPHIYDAVDDYPPFCLRAAEKTAADADGLGIVIGGSGNGEQIAANKVKGVRAILAWSVETAKLGREHNNANVISVGGRMHTQDEAVSFIEAFLATPYSDEERHTRRIEMLSAYEQTGELPRSRPTTRRADLPLRRAAGASGGTAVSRRRSTAVPEGHTIHRLAQDHTERFAGRPVRVSSPRAGSPRVRPCSTDGTWRAPRRTASTSSWNSATRGSTSTSACSESSASAPPRRPRPRIRSGCGCSTRSTGPTCAAPPPAP